jgi:segregation and condensation protein B
LETLVERGVIRVAGRAEVPGRPLIYETTESFLEHFGLRDLRELPNVEELRRAKLPEPVVPSPDQPELLQESAGTEVPAPAAEPEVESGVVVEPPDEEEAEVATEPEPETERAVEAPLNEEPLQDESDAAPSPN